MIVFDVDGTILPGTSCERQFVRHLVRQRILGLRHLVNFTIRTIELLPSGWYFMTKANKGYLRGFESDLMSELGKIFFREHLAGRISQVAISRVREHQARGEGVFLLSGMPDFLLRNFAEFLGVTEYFGSVMEIRDRRFSGRTLGPFPLARGKVAVLEPIVGRLRLSWQEITFYGDHYLDRFLLDKVGRPVVVNGDNRIIGLARSRGWPTEIWN